VILICKEHNANVQTNGRKICTCSLKKYLIAFMVTKEELKKEVDRLPESLLEEVYALLKRFVLQKKTGADENNWTTWKLSLGKFTPDFMNNREQSTHQTRESFDS
jgi:hypothetical protein